jgi:hypothetical protein
LVLGDVEETIYVVEENEDEEEVVRVRKHHLATLSFTNTVLLGRRFTKNQRCSLLEVCASLLRPWSSRGCVLELTDLL